MSMCRVFSFVIGRGCLPRPVRSLGKTLLAFALLHSVLQGQICRYFLISYFCIPVCYNEKDIIFWVLILEGLVGLHKTVQLQFLQHYWLGHRLGLLCILNGLPWKWADIILSFLRLHPSTAFRTLLLTVMATPFLLRDSCPHILDIWDSMLLFSSSVMSDSLLTPWTAAYQAPLPMGFSRQEYWSGLPLPPPNEKMSFSL